MMGIGQPQYPCREIPQSRRRQVVCFSPRPRELKSDATASTAAWKFNPSYGPEFTQRPCSAYQGCHAFTEYLRPSTSMTVLIGSLYFLANSKSRSSCAGTPMTAPSP